MRKVSSWDEYHMREALHVATRSKDPNTQVGAVLVDKNNHQLISGYNGFIAGTLESDKHWERPEKYDHVVHAEANAIGYAARVGIAVGGSVLYVTAMPCHPCMMLVLAAGIRSIEAKCLLHGWDQSHEKAMIEAERAGVLVHIWEPEEDRIRRELKEGYGGSKDAPKT